MDSIQTSITSKDLAETNRERVLRLIYSEKQITRRSIGDYLNLSTPTVAKIVDKLVQEGLIEESGSQQSSGGRKPKTLSFVPFARFAVGVSITSNHLRLVLVDLWGSVHSTRNYRIKFEATDAYLQQVAEIINQFIYHINFDQSKLLGVGISICGTVRENSLVVEYSSLLGIRNWDISYLTKVIEYPILIINDAYAAGSIAARTNDRMNRMFYVSISDGISGAYIINNDILNGFNNRAGAIGHMVVPRYEENSVGTFEEVCSTCVLTNPFQESLETFFVKLEEGEPEHEKAWDVYMHNLARGLANIRFVVDVAIVIGGSISSYLEEYVDRIIELIHEIDPFEDKLPFIRVAASGPTVAASGAALQFVVNYLDF